MADLGSIGRLATSHPNADTTPRANIRAIVTHAEKMIFGGRDDSEGNSAPSLRMDAKGKLTIAWPVDNRERNVTVQVKQAANLTPRPRFVLKAEPSLGISSDVEAVAPSGTGWVTCGPINFTASGDGVVEFVLETRCDAQYRAAPCFWDNINEELA